jgi:hypothetical protein
VRERGYCRPKSRAAVFCGVLFLFGLVIFDQSSAVFTSAGFFYDMLGVVGKNSSSENTVCHSTTAAVVLCLRISAALSCSTLTAVCLLTCVRSKAAVRRFFIEQ